VNAVVMGPPGAGKGTQVKMLADGYGFLHLSPGALLRQAVKEGSDLGAQAKAYMEDGQLVPDALVIELLRSRLAETEGSRGVVLDGFPRTLGQAEALGEMLAQRRQNLDIVINMELPEAEAIRRLTGRRVCRQCGTNYHLVSKPPASEGRCDLCGGPLYQRSDDSEETARARLAVYRRETEPLIEFYSSRGVLRSISGQGGVADVRARLERALGLGR